MQIALIGIGKIANYQMQAITHTQGIKLVDAHDLDQNKAEELPGSVQFHDDLEKMLKKSKADAFLVSTPTPSHFEVAMRVIEADRGSSQPFVGNWLADLLRCPRPTRVPRLPSNPKEPRHGRSQSPRVSGSLETHLARAGGRSDRAGRRPIGHSGTGQ